VRAGILALQGDFASHREALRARGVETVEVRSISDLEGLAGLVFPGGESTTMLKLMNGTGLAEALTALLAGGLPALATCAGVILLAREVHSPAQRSLGVLDVVVERNAYGRQLESTVAAVEVASPELFGVRSLEGVFIRAPRVRAFGPGVEALARRGGDVVLLRQGKLLAATFHPELSRVSPVVDFFVRQLGGGR
jgi:5'-phosphate synthase pdxT subunit